VVLVAGLAVALLRPSSSSLLFRHCFFSLFPLLPLSTMFFSLYSGVVEVLVVVSDRRMAEMVVGLWSAVFSLSSFFFSTFLFNSVLLCFPFSFCFQLCCCRLGRQWQLVVVERTGSVPGGVTVAGKKMGGLFLVSGGALLLLSSPA
jgi:hypothetical protein